MPAADEPSATMDQMTDTSADDRDAQAILTIDLDALSANWRLLAARAAAAECGAVIKADAYGTGIADVAPALARAGCRTFFTAHVAEGRRARLSLRAAGFPDEIRIFILNGFRPEAAPFEAYARARLSPVLCSMEQIAAWTARRGNHGLGSAVHIDTGMNRAGLGAREALDLDQETLDAAGIGLVMSHLVSAEDPDDPITALQAERFDATRCGALGRLPASLANSSGTMRHPRTHYDLVRPGYALYGGNPTPGTANPMRAVVGLRARILQTRRIAKGEPVGYNGRWIAPRDTVLATIGVGYADGLPRNARTIGGSAGPVALLGATRCPMVGRISMDLSIIDVTDAAEAAHEGAEVELLGPTLTVDDLGAQTGTVGYEILTGLGRRYIRRYVDGLVGS